MASMAEIYGTALRVKACPKWGDYPGEVNPGGRVMIRDENHPCHGCAQEAGHKVPGRAHFPADTEAGGTLPFDDVYAWPGMETIYRMLCVSDELAHCALQPITGSVSNLLDGKGNSFVSEVISGQVISASGNTLTVKTLADPFDCYVQLWEDNPDFEEGVDNGEGRYVNRGIRTQVQPGDLVGFIGSEVAGKILCRVEEVTSSSWGGPSSTWTFRVSQSVSHADQPLRPLFDAALFTISREAVAPRNWIEPRPSYPLFVARIEGARISYEDMLASPMSPRVELLDTGGASCRIAIPSAPSPLLGWAGSFRALKNGATDVTSAVANSIQIEHIGSSGYRTTIDAGAHLSTEGDELVILYEPEWRAADGEKVKRASCQSICHHSKYHPKIGWACGLGGRRLLDPDDDNNPANMPPDGIANYREGSEAGCYQLGTCSDFTPSDPFSYQTDFAGFLVGIHNGYLAREQQGFPGSQAGQNFTTERPFYPSGVPGLGPMAGRIAQTASGYHALRQLVPGFGGAYRWVTGSNGSRKIRAGAEIDITDGPRQWDLSAGETPKPGLFNSRTVGGAIDSFGEPWNSDNDPTKGLRDAGGRLPSCSTADSGLATGLSEAERQRATERRIVLPRVALGAGATSAQVGDWMTAILGEDDSLTLGVHPLGDARDTGYGLTAKVSGTVAAASSAGGGLVRLEIANQQRQCTVAGPMTESHTPHLTGGHFCKLPDAYQPYDPNDPESAIEGANIYRGAIRGDSARFTGVAGASAAAIQEVGFYVSKALPCEGTEETWGGSNPAPPAGWIAAPKNYEDWLAKRDVIWVYDRDDGILASNAANLVGSTVACYVAGIIAPVGDLTVYHAPYQSDWSVVDPSDIESIDRWRGRVVLKPVFIEALDRTTQHCFRIDCKLMDRRRPVAAFHFREVLRKQATMTQLPLAIGNGSDNRIYTVFQQENPFNGNWGLNQSNLRSIEMFANSTALGGSVFDPEAVTGPAESWRCNTGYYVDGEASLTLGEQTPGSEKNAFLSTVSSTAEFGFGVLSRRVVLQLASYTGIGLLGSISNFPAGTEIVSASCNIRMGGLKQVRTLFEFEAAGGGGGFDHTETVTLDQEGAGTFRLGLYGYRVDPETGNSFATLLGSGGEVSTTDGEWRTVDITDIATQALKFRDSEWLALALVPMPTLVDIPPGSDVGDALAGYFPEVDWDNQAPAYIGCSGDPSTPVVNPDILDRKGSWTSEQLEWGNFEATDAIVQVSWPSDFGEDVVPLNDSNGHNWPPKNP